MERELICLYQDHGVSDLQLKCGNVSFAVHKNILSTRSPVFKTMLSSDTREAMSGCVDIGDLDPSTLGRFLAFLYTGAVEDLQGESALKLYYAADKYQVDALKRECSDLLCSNVSLSNVCDILSLADRHQDNRMKSAAHDFILNNYQEVSRSNEWKNFQTSETKLAAYSLGSIAEQALALKRECSDLLLCSNVSLSNVCDILSLADRHQDNRMKSAAHDFILNNYQEVSRSNEWKNFLMSETKLAAYSLGSIAEQALALKRECSDLLCSNVSLSNVCDILSLADRHQDNRMKSAAHDFILNNHQEVLRSKKWQNFKTSEAKLAAYTLGPISEQILARRKKNSK